MESDTGGVRKVELWLLAPLARVLWAFLKCSGESTGGRARWRMDED